MNGDPLAGLKDIHLPADIGWWPPAPGWWLLAVVAGPLFYFLARRVVAWLRNRRYRREAISGLRKSFAAYGKHGDGYRFLCEVSVLLRRLAIHRYGRTVVADLTGTDWLEFLDRTGKTGEFTGGAGSALGEAIYSGKAEGDPEKIVALAEQWIRVQR
ncbi:MAG: DUF4381 domain-containing protein [Proteobacteria bacterium]|nr:DUF4381 domain-containing protein [Pseudomonadota bacterium]MBU1736713.1 DUF4381 domain-containing protein [Pseudomonadota bacterium]